MLIAHGDEAPAGHAVDGPGAVPVSAAREAAGAPVDIVWIAYALRRYGAVVILSTAIGVLVGGLEKRGMNSYPAFVSGADLMVRALGIAGSTRADAVWSVAIDEPIVMEAKGKWRINDASGAAKKGPAYDASRLVGTVRVLKARSCAKRHGHGQEGGVVFENVIGAETRIETKPALTLLGKEAELTVRKEACAHADSSDSVEHSADAAVSALRVGEAANGNTSVNRIAREAGGAAAFIVAEGAVLLVVAIGAARTEA